MSARNRPELFEAEARYDRKARQRRERHRVHDALVQTRARDAESVADLDLGPCEVRFHHQHPEAWKPKRKRVWKMPFWKRRNNVRAERALAERRIADPETDE
jgi:hypothetical protein